MAGIWDDIKKGVGGFASKAAEKAGELSREAAEKAEEMTQLGKIKLDIFQIKRDIDKKYTDMGRVVYSLLNQETKTNVTKDENVIKLVNDLKELEKKLKEKEAHYQKIQESSKEDTTKPVEPDQSNDVKNS
ncbi:MAG TPA: hypothetical protein P5268_03950 [Candidatus Marinimicrobia bacterium]|nr:hypothetical protein [Candidatus Neomarinimicrobiota bacterium]HRS51676.1 hypothetical protein [Candidatus Neomarinimicrobiota bacterium]HRU92174.1 hypothetical protein [Candidatus Neomarinimicrobiota bacterium]